MRLDYVKNLNHEDDFIFAISVGDEGGYPHCAVFYKWDDNLIKTIDFWSNQRIRNNITIEDFASKDYLYIHYNRDSIIDPFALQVPSVCELIAEKNEKINFGIKFTESKFNQEGDLVYANGDFGLTCATFVLALLQRAGITLIDLNKWQVRDSDSTWQEIVLKYYEEKNRENKESYSSDLINHYKKNLGCFRYRPEEIAAASSCSELPTDIAYCEIYGERINEAISYGVETYNKIYIENA